MGYSFDGTTKRITLSTGTSEFVVNDIYSRWKDWVLDGNAKYLPAFRAIGGEDIGSGQSAGVYVFLGNGWSIIPAAVSQLTVVGNLVRDPEDLSGVPVFQQIGSQIQIIQRVSVVAIGYEAGGGTTITPAQVWNYSDRTLSASGISAIASAVVSGLSSAFRTLVNAISGKASQSSVDAVAVNVQDIKDLSGYTDGNPMTANPTSGTITTLNGKRVIRTESGGSATYTRDDA